MNKLVTFTLTCLLSVSALFAEQTFTMIKPDAVAANHIGEILAQYENSGLHVVALKMVKMTPEEAMKFYAVHKERPFYSELVSFVSSGPVVAIVLDGDNAVKKTREIIGATDPKEAAQGTIRARFAASKQQNAIHGSDSIESAKEEISFFFNPQEIVRK